MHNKSSAANSHNTSIASQGQEEETTAIELPKKRACIDELNKIWIMMEERARAEAAQKEQSPRAGVQQVEWYVQNTARQLLPRDSDPIQFWASQEDKYPILAPHAIDLLSIPASSAAVERIFSIAGESTIGKRNRLTHSNLEREILLRKNGCYLIDHY